MLINMLQTQTDNNVKQFSSGFLINWMNMKDAANGKLLWSSGKWYEITHEFYFSHRCLSIQ